MKHWPCPPEKRLRVGSFHFVQTGAMRVSLSFRLRGIKTPISLYVRKDGRNMDEQIENRDKLAREILLLSRNTLLVNLRFLDMALSRLQYVPCDRSTLMTDGERLIYHALTC